ncbi:MAG: transposase [Bacteroidales bacterium]|nr:transposase [Bacteroidales bacterium]
MKTSRRFSRGVLNHVYQRTVNGFVIFYCISDYLVYFTTMCVVARKYGVRILMVSLMPDHIHISAIASRKQDLSAFMRELNKSFSYNHNIVCHHSGSLFDSPFGSAPKYGDKNVRTNLIYVGNNGPERKLAAKAEEYRWNFLAYAETDHPFSEKLVVRRASSKMRRALSEVKSTFAKGRPMAYMQLKRLFSKLDSKEKEQLTDFIICTYNVIDYTAAIKYFGSYEDMLLAMHSTTGSEHDINEVVIGKSDAHYSRMSSVCLKTHGLKDIHDVLALDNEAKMYVFQLLQAQTDALLEQICAFLRIPFKKVK